MQAETERRPADANPTGTLVSDAAFIGFSAAQLIDEFLWNAPQEFHLREGTTLLLALLFVTALAGLLAGAAMQRPTSTFGLALIGALIAVADVSKHAPEIAAAGPWRSGLISTSLAAGLTLSAALTAVLRSTPGGRFELNTGPRRCPTHLHPAHGPTSSACARERTPSHFPRSADRLARSARCG